MADHCPRAAGGDGGPGSRCSQTRDERNDDDAEDRHRRDPGCKKTIRQASCAAVIGVLQREWKRWDEVRFVQNWWNWWRRRDSSIITPFA